MLGADRATPDAFRPIAATPPGPPEPRTFVLQEGFDADRASASPTGGLVAGCKRGGRLLVWRARDLALLASFALPTFDCPEPVWGPTGSVVSLTDEDTFCWWDVSRAERVACEPLDEGADPVTSASGAAVALHGAGDEAVIVDLTTGQARRKKLPTSASLAAVSDSGQLVAFLVVATTTIWSAATDTTFDLESGPIELAPGDRRAAIRAGKNIDVWDLTKHERIAEIEGDTPLWSPKGDRLSFRRKGETAVWFADSNRVGDPPLAVSPEHAAWIGDDRLGLLDADKGLRVIDVTTGKSVSLGRSTAWDWWPSPDGATVVLAFQGLLGGRVVVARDRDGALVLVRLEDGAQLWVRAAESDGKCGVFVHGEDGSFDGDPRGRVTFRRGDDLRSAAIESTGDAIEPHHRPGLLADFLSGASTR